jgi:hypothetical protein
MNGFLVFTPREHVCDYHTMFFGCFLRDEMDLDLSVGPKRNLSQIEVLEASRSYQHLESLA